MKIFVGLGNPGSEYAATKHNVGFMLADALARELVASNWREDFRALISDTFVDGEKVFLVKPLTFMNLSGEAVRPIMDYYKLTPDDLIVAHDDMDLATGVIRLRPKGSGGGHHGVESIIQHLGGNENFARIRIGVGRPPFNESLIPHTGPKSIGMCCHPSTRKIPSKSKKRSTILFQLRSVLFAKVSTRQ